MGLKLRFPLRREQYAVYSLEKHWREESPSTSDRQAVWANPELVARLFASEPRLEQRFQGFLRKKCWGIFHVVENQWASYAWMTTAGQSGPAHMPSAGCAESYWVFHCRTQLAYQGQGLYKQSLRMLAGAARRKSPKAELFIDTQLDNLPSRKAIVAVGFESYGLVNTWTLTLPKLKTWTIARWQQRKQNPTTMLRAA